MAQISHLLLSNLILQNYQISLHLPHMTTNTGFKFILCMKYNIHCALFHGLFIVHAYCVIQFTLLDTSLSAHWLSRHLLLSHTIVYVQCKPLHFIALYASHLADNSAYMLYLITCNVVTVNYSTFTAIMLCILFTSILLYCHFSCIIIWPTNLSQSCLYKLVISVAIACRS